MDTSRSDCILLVVVAAAAAGALIACGTVALRLRANWAALRPGACRPAASAAELGELLFEVPRISGADQPWRFPASLSDPSGERGSASLSSESSERPAGEAPAPH